jgi:hypothetical protein
MASSDLRVDVLENCQSEYLQFTLFILRPRDSSSADRPNPRSSTRPAPSPTRPSWSDPTLTTVEFLAVGSMAVLAIYLRQRGSPESKPVGAPHDAPGVEG